MLDQANIYGLNHGDLSDANGKFNKNELSINFGRRIHIDKFNLHSLFLMEFNQQCRI